MIPIEILELAEKGGYKLTEPEELLKALPTFRKFMHKAILLDADFWRALSKSLNWDKTTSRYLGWDSQWMYEANRLFNIILMGYNPQEFWNEILSARK